MTREWTWTPQQLRAIRTIDRSLLVSAAAGSGKTAVLAERCAYLVCDAPPQARVDVDRLLVVTFTEAAAAEMKERIRRAIRARSAAHPQDRRLRSQAVLVDTAQISTLHAFCLWMTRRWFHRIGVDATAQLLDEDEARLLREDTLRALFDERYRDPGGAGERFARLVEDYGLGYDGGIAAFVLKLAAFVESLPDPPGWLAMARDEGPARRAAIVGASRQALAIEVARQAEHCRAAAAMIARDLPAGEFYAGRLAEYGAALQAWQARLRNADAGDEVRAEIAAYELSSKGSPRLAREAAEETIRQRDGAREVFNEVRDTLLKKRLQAALCRFTEADLHAGLARTQPYIETFAELAAAFLERFAAVKRSLGVMDFADLERFAHRLLTESPAAETDNPVVDELRQRFIHVLVDEFQDINPLQARLLNLVSREEDRSRPGNLFTVGDVKQSIYRFRLAEPGMFLDRERDFRRGIKDGSCIDLQCNYRSRRRILDGVNALFRRLMRADCGGIAYDEHAELKAPDPHAPPGEPIEVHLLERRLDDSAEEDAGDEPRYVDVTDPAQWRTVEREAFLVGSRIRELRAAGAMVNHADGPQPLQYRDICVLLRSTRHTAAPVVELLNQMGVPAWTEAGSDLFSAREVREVLALLAVLDNPRQDIPLAAVLRCGILGAGLDEDELAAVRVFDRDGPFHEAVFAYATLGPPGKPRDKLATLLERVRRYRRQVRQRPLADVLWTIYRETDYLAYVGGLAGGGRRRANLIALHERARQFGQFRRQGLRRFLRFLSTLEEEGDDLGAPAGRSLADDAVRVMSIHKAKGLEFPVVFVAEMGRRFNLGDCTGRLLFDRRVGLGLKAVDRQRLIEYPSALHQACSRESEEAALAEELRVWYVATTRARKRLILVGTDPLEAIERRRAVARSEASQLPALTVLTARAPLHWIVAALGHMPADRVAWNVAGARADDVDFRVTLHDADAVRSWSLTQRRHPTADPLHRAVANLEPLPADEPVSAEPIAAEGILARLDYAYAHLGVSSIPAARAASEAKRRFLPPSDADEAEPLADPRPAAAPSKPAADRDEAAHRGRVVHCALQFLSLNRAADAGAILADLQRLVVEGILATEDLALVDVDALAWFFDTDLGRRIRTAPQAYRREWMFLSAEPVTRFDPTVSGAEDDRVVVRGVVDGLLATETGLEVIDFKTDRVEADGVAARAARYATQIGLYASAVAEVYHRPVRARYLVFLHARRIVEVSEDEL